MKKLLSVSLMASVLAASSMIVAAPAHAIPSPGVTLSSTTVAQGGSVDVTVTEDVTVPWCVTSTGPGFSMGIGLFGEGEPIFLPAGVGDSDTGIKGFGDFTWSATTATATVTIPETVPAGTYEIFAGCISEGPLFQQLGSGYSFDGFVVTAAPAAPLPDTGQDNSATILFSGLAAGVLLVLGAAFIVVRRRIS